MSEKEITVKSIETIIREDEMLRQGLKKILKKKERKILLKRKKLRELKSLAKGTDPRGTPHGSPARVGQ